MKKEDKYIIIFMFLILAFYSIPLLNDYISYGHDLFYHFSRIQASAELLKIGNFDLSILPGFYNSFGYAAGIFYPTGLLIIPIILVSLGLNIVLSYKIFIIFITAITLLTSYYSCYKILNHKYLALFSSFIYVFSVYRNYSDLFERAAVGEYISMAFIPLIFYGIFAIFSENKIGKYFLVLGISGVLLTHTITSMMSISLLVFFVLINIKKFFSSRYYFIEIVKAALLTLLLTAFYWLPMIEMMMSDEFFFNIPWTHIWLNTLDTPLKSFYFSTEFSQFPYGIELIAVFIIILYIILNIKDIFKNFYLRNITILFLVTIVIASNLIPVNLIRFLDFMLFEWRLYMFISYFASVLLAVAIFSIQKVKIQKSFIIGLVVIYLFNFVDYSKFYNEYRMQDYHYTSFIRYTMFDFEGKEFLPSTVNTEFLVNYPNPKEIQKSNPIILEYKSELLNYHITFNQLEYTNTSLEIPFVYYKGYAAYVVSNNSSEFLEIVKSKNSLISINLGNIKEGSIRIFYNGTYIQRFSKIISLFTLFVIISYFIYIQFLKKKVV